MLKITVVHFLISSLVSIIVSDLPYWVSIRQIN